MSCMCALLLKGDHEFLQLIFHFMINRYITDCSTALRTAAGDLDHTCGWAKEKVRLSNLVSITLGLAKIRKKFAIYGSRIVLGLFFSSTNWVKEKFQKTLILNWGILLLLVLTLFSALFSHFKPSMAERFVATIIFVVTVTSWWILIRISNVPWNCL